MPSGKIKGEFPNRAKVSVNTDKSNYGYLFNSSLYKEELPKASLRNQSVQLCLAAKMFGPERWSLYFKTAFWTVRNNHQINQFVCLVLVEKTNDRALQWCEEHLVPIALESNPLLWWNKDNGKLHGVDAYRESCDVCLYTTVEIVGDIKWDGAHVEWGYLPASTESREVCLGMAAGYIGMSYTCNYGFCVLFKTGIPSWAKKCTFLV